MIRLNINMAAGAKTLLPTYRLIQVVNFKVCFIK